MASALLSGKLPPRSSNSACYVQLIVSFVGRWQGVRGDRDRGAPRGSKPVGEGRNCGINEALLCRISANLKVVPNDKEHSVRDLTPAAVTGTMNEC